MNETFWYRELAADRVANFRPNRSIAPNSFLGQRGIVTCGGGPVYFVQAYILIGVLRKLGCQLPIECWHWGDAEMSPTMRETLKELSVVPRDAMEVAKQQGITNVTPWMIKPLSVLHSKFDQVLYLDSDSVPVHDPTYLFDDPIFQDLGSLFWTDRYRGSGSPFPTVRPRAWEFANVPFRDEPEFESGQFLCDRNRCARELFLTCHFNELAEIYYQFVYGDKDTFRLAWHRLGRPFATVPYGPSSPHGFRVLYHFDPSGNLVFQHRARSKWSMYQRNDELPGFQHHQLCIDLLNKLRVDWELIENELEKQVPQNVLNHRSRLVGKKNLWCRIGRKSWQPIQFRSNGTIETNLPLIPTHWQLVEQPGGDISLNLMGDRAAPMSLRLHEDVWIGRRQAGTRPAVAIVQSQTQPPSVSAGDCEVVDPYDQDPKFQSAYENATQQANTGITNAYWNPQPPLANLGIKDAYLSSPPPIALGNVDFVSPYSTPPPSQDVSPNLAASETAPEQTVYAPLMSSSVTADAYSEPATLQARSAKSIDNDGVLSPQRHAELKIHGLPRTCTNLIARQLAHHFDATVYSNRRGWKHGANLLREGDVLNGQPVQFVVCVKHPYPWLVSFHRFERQGRGSDVSFEDFVLGSCLTYREQNPIDVYNYLNRMWLGAFINSSSGQLVRSEQFQSDQVATLSSIEASFRLRRTKACLEPEFRRIGPDEIVRPRKFDSSYYDDQKFMRQFNKALLWEVNDRLDHHLIARLGYRLSDTSFPFDLY